MNQFLPIQKQSLSDNLALRIKKYIIARNFGTGERLPTTAELANRFGVGQPTIREAIKKLEAAGIVKVKHGSGIYVDDQVHHLFMPNPIISTEPPTQKMLFDLIEAKIPIEVQAVTNAAEHITEAQVKRIEELLAETEKSLDDEEILNNLNIEFHKEIAMASDNYLLYQIIDVLSKIFEREQRYLLDHYLSKRNDYFAHVRLFDAIKNRRPEEAAELMREHLYEFRKSIAQWDPAEFNSVMNHG